MSEQQQSSTAHELVDVVDKRGEPTGRVLEKWKVHEQGLLHRDVHVWGVQVRGSANEAAFLQQLRTRTKAIMPREWDITASGHVGAGNSYRDDAAREMGEELGLWLPTKRFIRLGRLAVTQRIPAWEHPHRTISDNYAVLLDPDLTIADLTLQESEVDDARFWPLNQLEHDIASPSTAHLHAPQPLALYALGIAGMRDVVSIAS